jgi:hypothetical protein
MKATLIEELDSGIEVRRSAIGGAILLIDGKVHHISPRDAELVAAALVYAVRCQECDACQEWLLAPDQAPECQRKGVRVGE